MMSKWWRSLAFAMSDLAARFFVCLVHSFRRSRFLLVSRCAPYPTTMADQASHDTPEGFFLTEEEERALAAATSSSGAALPLSVSAVSDTLPSPGGAWTVPDPAPSDTTPPVLGPDSGSGSSAGWAPPGDYYQAPQSSSGSHWSGYGTLAPTPIPSVLVRPGASDGQLLDGLSLLSPDVRHRLLSILQSMLGRPSVWYVNIPVKQNSTSDK